MFQDFETKTTEHSHINAYWLGRASMLAYQPSEKIETQVKEWGLDQFILFDRQSTQAYIGMDEHVMILAFRGTELTDLRDILTNFDLDLVPSPGGGRVHEGFYTAFSYIWPEIWDFICNNRRGQSLWVTGHSMGGALAMVAAAQLRLDKQEPINGCYTFGQPRIGDAEFAQRFDDDFKPSMHRYVNNNDIVPRIPKRAMGYADAGLFHYFNKQGRFTPEMSWADLIADRIQGQIENLFAPGTDLVADHEQEAYMACLKRAYDEAVVTRK